MGYYEKKVSELRELLELLRKEKADFERRVQREREIIDKKVKVLSNQRLSEIKVYERQAKQKLDEAAEERRKIEVFRHDTERQLDEQREAILQLAQEKSQGFPWLAEAYAQYLYLQDLKKADSLEDKAHPAPKAAEQIREVAFQRRLAEELHRVLKYKLEYYERLFPWLIDFTGEDIDDLIRQIVDRKEKRGEDLQEPDDAAKKWLTDAEYRTLPTVEKYQRALDRYRQRPNKPKWEIGRDYERYVGYQYESDGYGVYYQGIVEGFADLGRDLICVRGETAEVVQCKYWSREKQIHEKHIFQLYGTFVAYRIDHPDKDASACFVTSASLSEQARKFATYLGIKISENFPLEHYPCIKCNVSRRDGTKIYHLPFDQQYDRTLIEEERNECYVETVKEAEDLGFRRAFRWRGTTGSSDST